MSELRGRTVVYITERAPLGRGEEFVFAEIIDHIGAGLRVLVIPVRSEDVGGQKGDALAVKGLTISVPLTGLTVFFEGLAEFLRNPGRVLVSVVRLLMKSGGVANSLRNLSVVPKSLVLARLLRPLHIDHIHSYWATLPATVGYLVSSFVNVSWSLTAHRWDIAARNALALKADRALFVRAISRRGANRILNEIGKAASRKVQVVHIGVRVGIQPLEPHVLGGVFTIACPANLVSVKGHRYLIEAMVQLLERSPNGYILKVLGDGPLESGLRAMTRQLGIEGAVEFAGRIPHSELLSMLERHEVDCVALPSISLEDGTEEGIPVALMEAMAHGIPVISTDTGAIPELLGADAGIVVPEKDANALAEAIWHLSRSPELYRRLSVNGWQRISDEFNITRESARLRTLMFPGPGV